MEKQRSTEYRAAPDARQEDQVVAGRNPVIELLRSGRPVDKILIVRQQEGGGSLGRIVAMAKQAGIPVKDAAREKLDALCPGINHQGVAAFAAACSYCEVEELLARAGEEPPFLVIADGIEDPHNLGAIIRSADAAGAHGMIIPRRGGAGLTAAVMKASAGAAGGKPRLHSAGAAKEKHLGLCCGYGRRGLVHRRLRGRGGACHRLGRVRGVPSAAGTQRPDSEPADVRQGEFAQRFGGGGHPPLRGRAPAPGDQG